MLAPGQEVVRIDVERGHWHESSCGRNPVYDVGVIAGLGTDLYLPAEDGIQLVRVAEYRYQGRDLAHIDVKPYISFRTRSVGAERFGILTHHNSFDEIKRIRRITSEDISWLTERPTTTSFTRKRGVLFAGRGGDLVADLTVVQDLELQAAAQKIAFMVALTLGMCRCPQNFIDDTQAQDTSLPGIAS